MVSFSPDLAPSEHICVVVGRQLYGKRTIRKEERNVLFNGYILLPYTKHLMLIKNRGTWSTQNCPFY